MKPLPCRICGATPAPVKRPWKEVVPHLGRGVYSMVCELKSFGRYTRFVCECGLKSTESVAGVKAARVLWNDENLEAHLQRQLIEATNGKK
jgi:hypothetical protein